jgi:glutamate-ammonia-ligase adenylyltransferase
MAYSERPGGLSELARFGFVNLTEALGRLDELVKLVGDAGRSAIAYLAKSADPDAALLALVKLAETHPAKIKALLRKDDSAQRLCFVLGASTALSEFLERHPANLDLFDEKAIGFPNRDELTRRLVGAVQPLLKPGFDSQAVWVELRIEYRRQLCRIAIADLAAPEPTDVMPQVAAALADLAGAAIEAGLAVARAELALTDAHGKFDAHEVDDTRLAVIAMGKCGARELNYISDVDVIYVAESAAPETSDQRAVEIATKLATRMMRAMDATAVEPPLWQVDPNLRPEGKSGALVRTLASHVSYYERWAESWEFQALLKARPLAGDWELGQSYVTALAPMVWASASRDNFVESAQRMRERVMEHIPAHEVDRQIKLGPGGLRDVEFTVQLLQLVHGRTDESLRQRDTLSALDALMAGGYVSRADAERFAQHYRFLRTLEHRIQLSQLRRTHLMPESETAQRAIARAINPRWTAEDLQRHWQSVKQDVRSLHQQIFYRPLLSAVAKLDENALELSNNQAADRLRAIGFANPEGALVHIRALTAGLSRRAAIQKQLLPVLIQWFSEGTDPDSALLAFRRLSEDLGESHWYLRMLRDTSGAAKRMTQVLANSRLATELFERIPEGAAWFEREDELTPQSGAEIESEIEAISARHESIDAAAVAIKHIRRRETLRIAMGAVLGTLKLRDVERGITDLTESYLRGMLNCVLTFKDAEIAERPVGEILDFAVVAMGRFGGAELGFGSDADVMFVHQPQNGVTAEEAQRVAERIINELRRLCVDPVLEFELDLDLRPEGKKGAIARTIDSYASYYERWSDTWEAQALLRARVIAGSAELREAFTQLIDKYRYPQNLSAAAVLEVRRIKARVETERLPQGADPKRHLKLGRGSLSDVEWLVQLLQLQHGATHPSIRTPSTLEALGNAVKEGLIAEEDASTLSEAWLLASRARSASVLWANKRTDVLPSDRRQLEGMARILEYPAGSATDFEQEYLAATRRSRAVFERLFYQAVE